MCAIGRKNSMKISAIENRMAKRAVILTLTGRLSVRARQLLLMAVGVLLMAGVAGCGGSAPKLSKLPADAVILAFGDSLTFGTGAQPEASYPAVLEQRIGRKVWAAGVPGEVSAAGLARLPSALDYYQPALLILCHGGNDFLRKLGDAGAAQNLRAMIRLAQARGVAVVLIGVPKPGLFPSPPDFYAEIASEFGLPYEGAALQKILRDNELKSDLAHPNARGYAMLAEAVAALLKGSGAL
jgi:lysophospholipase L1-like esterase